MRILRHKVAVSTAVAALISGLLVGNVNAITASTSYGKIISPVAAGKPLALATSGGLHTLRISSINVAAEEPTSSRLSTLAMQAAAGIPKKPMPDALDIWLDRLAHQESRGRADIRVLDLNNRYSYGCLQFQLQTFKSYARQYGMLQDAEHDDDYRRYIYDCDIQKKLARFMIEDDYNNWRHWLTSIQTKVGLPPKITAKKVQITSN